MQSALGLDPKTSPSIDWQSNDKTRIPSLVSPRTSIRHFALCIVPVEVWNDPTRSLRQKFQRAKFWELLGPNTGPEKGECVTWNLEKIESIDGMIEIGVVSHSDDYVSEQCEYRLMKRLLKLSTDDEKQFTSLSGCLERISCRLVE